MSAGKDDTMKILFAASEVAPFIKTGGLADVAGSLPPALAEKGHDVRVILPLYEGIGDQWRSQMTFLKYYYVHLAWRSLYCGLFELKKDGVTYYFVDNEGYFKRSGIYGHYDDGERFAYFSRAIIETPDQIGWHPDIIHANDWQMRSYPSTCWRSASAAPCSPTPGACSPSTTSSIRGAMATRCWRICSAWMRATSMSGC